MKILHVEPQRYDGNTRALLAELGDVDYVECSNQQALLRAATAAPYDALFARLGLSFDARLFDAMPKLRWLVTPTTGVDHIDLAVASERGVEVISLRGETAFLDTIRSTAEHTWALLLALARRLPTAHRDVLAGRWRRDPFLATELAGKRLGILGLGRLGRMVAGYGLAFHMHVQACDSDPAAFVLAPEGVGQVELDAVLSTSDVVSLHLPLNDATVGLVSRARLEQIKRGALLVNTARGELLDESALLDALRSGHLAGAALDVIAGDGRWDDGVPAGHPLVEYAREHENLILTPHVGGYGTVAIAATRRFVVQKLAARIGR